MSTSSEFVASLVGGASAGIVVDITLYPIDTIKTMLQVWQQAVIIANMAEHVPGTHTLPSYNVFNRPVKVWGTLAASEASTVA